MSRKLSGVTEFFKKGAGQLNENTSIPLKVLVPIFMFLIPATWKLSSQVSDVKHAFGEMSQKIQQVEKASWTKENMEIWTVKLERNNPTLNVPKPKEGMVASAPTSGEVAAQN